MKKEQNVKKLYVEPQILIVDIETQYVIATSPGPESRKQPNWYDDELD